MPKSRKRKKPALAKRLRQAAEKGRTGVLAREVMRTSPRLARRMFDRAKPAPRTPPPGLPK